MATPYDVIVVGARVAGSATALILARAGLRVLVVDRARFPSDTLSTHQLHVPAVARLERWGLLRPLREAGSPGVRRVRLDLGGVAVEGGFPSVDGVDAMYSPRRTRLDSALVNAAVAAGAELRESCSVEHLVWNGERVVGVRIRSSRRTESTERAGLVIGADGKHSAVADAVGAAVLRQHAPATMASYTYFAGVPLERGELYHRPGSAVAAFPTDDDLTIVYTASPLRDFAAIRHDREGHYLGLIDRCDDLGGRVRSGERAERLRTTTDLPHLIRKPHGSGWALVGDAGLVMDPISAQGISHAFRDAELLAGMIVQAAQAGRPLDTHLDRFHRARDAAALPMFALTAELTRLRPNPRTQRLARLIADQPEEVARFLGVFAGITTLRDYLSPRSLLPAVGVRGLAHVLAPWPRAPRAA